VKTDISGNLIWNITYGGALAETPFDIIKTSDGGYGILGTPIPLELEKTIFGLLKLIQMEI
jgi:hypothetical protein